MDLPLVAISAASTVNSEYGTVFTDLKVQFLMPNLQPDGSYHSGLIHGCGSWFDF